MAEEDDEDDTINNDPEEVLEDEVLLGIPGITNGEEFEDLSAQLGGGTTEISCSSCNKLPLIQIASLSAPFGKFDSRVLKVLFCQNCKFFSCVREQSCNVKDNTVETTPIIEKKREDLKFETQVTDQDLEELFAASSLKGKESTKTNNKNKNKTKKQPTGSTSKIITLKFVYEPDFDDGFTHELELLEKYNKEALESGEEVIQVSKTNFPSNGDHGEDFFERLSRDSRQRIRYCYDGIPLWPSKEFMKEIPKCSCGSLRRFEFQITPQALPEIQKLTGDDIEWSTIIIFCCEQSCETEFNEFVVVCPEI